MADTPPAASHPVRNGTPRNKLKKGRALLLGFGALLVLLTVTVGVWMQDEPPHDDSDLTGPIPMRSPGPTISEGLVELGALLPPYPEFFYSIGVDTPRPWPPGPLDREGWEAAVDVRTELSEYLETHDAVWAQLDAVIARSEFRETQPQGFGDPSPGMVEARQFATILTLRALERRLAGDVPGASSDLGRVLALGEGMCRDSWTPVVGDLVGIAIMQSAMSSLVSLLFDGPLDPNVEAQLLARIPFFEAHPDRLAWSLRNEYAMLSNAIETISDAADRQPSLSGSMLDRITFKPNRTRRVAAESFRDLIQRSTLPPGNRPAPSRVEESSSALDVLFRSNIGEKLLEMVLPTYESLFTKHDDLTTTERAVRILVALSVLERQNGELPVQLLAVSPALTGQTGTALIDPYAAKLFRYDATRGLLWSVGIDGVDNGAKESEKLRGASPLSPFKLADPTWIVPKPH